MLTSKGACTHARWCLFLFKSFMDCFHFSDTISTNSHKLHLSWGVCVLGGVLGVWPLAVVELRSSDCCSAIRADQTRSRQSTGLLPLHPQHPALAAPPVASHHASVGPRPCRVSHRCLIKGPGPLLSPGSRGPASRCAPLMSSSHSSALGPLLPRVGGVHGGGTVGPAGQGQHQAGGAVDGTRK